jgi:nucleoside recognition membrane protein YjiH
MKKLTKNIIITFMISSAIFCLGATVFTFIKNNKPKANDSTDILGRGKNYEK